MYPFIWSKGGGSQERMIVVEFVKLTEKLVGGALGAVEVDFAHNTYHYTTWEIKLHPSIRKKNKTILSISQAAVPMPYEIFYHREHIYKG